jgi:hypothetical protein
MSTQAFANATPNAGGLRVIVDIQNAINTGVIGSSNDPTQFNSAVGFTLDAQTQDDVTFSAGAFAVFTWTIHEHMENLSGDGNGFGPFSEHASFGFAPVLQDNDQFWTCDLTCNEIGDSVPGVGHVVDMTLTRTEQVPFTPGQVIHVFDHIEHERSGRCAGGSEPGKRTCGPGFSRSGDGERPSIRFSGKCVDECYGNLGPGR